MVALDLGRHKTCPYIFRGMVMHLRCTLEDEKDMYETFLFPLTLALSPEGRGDFRGNDELP